MDQSTDVKRSRSRPDPGENPFDEEAHRVVATQAGVKKAEGKLVIFHKSRSYLIGRGQSDLANFTLAAAKFGNLSSSEC